MLGLKKDNDYAYISVFIDYLERIVNIVLKLFGLGKKDEGDNKEE